MTLQQEFADAKALHAADELLFLPLIEKFVELKKVLRGNFIMKQKDRKWYGKTTWEVKPAIMVDIVEKVNHSTGKYLFIRIDGCGYVMGIGQLGELKDRLYFCEGRVFGTKDKTVVHIEWNIVHNIDYCLENKLTTVQLFSYLIKKYNQYIVGN